MTINLPLRVASRRGMSLLELTITILVLLGIISIVFVGAHAWKRGSDKAACILTLRNIQMATRCYQNLYNYNCGGRPCAENGSQDIARHLYDKGYIEQKLYEQSIGLEPCPSHGSYTCTHRDIFPEPGELFMTCSLADSEDHQPSSCANW